MNKPKKVHVPRHLGLYLAVSIVPLLLLLGSVLMVSSKLERDIGFTRLEIEGVHELEALYNVILLLQHHRALQQLQDVALADQAESKQYADSLVASIDASIAEPHAASLGMADELLKIRQRFGEVSIEADAAHDRFSEQSILVDRLLALMEVTADRSRLSLDQYLNSHVQSDLLTIHLPRATEALALVHGLAVDGRDAAGKGSDSEFDRAVILYRDRVSGLRDSVSELKLLMHADEVAVYAELGRHIDQMDRFVDTIVSRDQTVAASRQFFDEISGLIKTLQQNYSEVAVALRERLTERYDNEVRLKATLVLGALFAALIFLALIAVLFRRNKTALNKALEAQRQQDRSQDMLRTVLDSIPVRVFWRDAVGHYAGCNQLFCSDAGLESPDHIVGKTELGLAWLDGNEDFAARDKIIRSESRLRCANGDVIWVEASRVPLVDRDNQPCGELGVYHDISTRKAAETALLESEARQRSIFESVVDGLITINDSGVVQDFNPAAEKTFGYSAAEVIGQKINMLMPEKYAAEHDDYMNNYHNTGHAKVIGIGREVEGKRKDGSVFPLDLAVNELWLGGRRLYSGIVRDITERKRVEKIKNEFISTVSHELRTPLTSIRGSLGLVQGGALGQLPEKAAEMLKIASNNTERLLLLINDILDIQKIESGVMAFRFQSLDLVSFTQEAMVDHTGYAEQHGIRFVIDCDFDDAHVYADRDRLMQVLANLMSNAAKFSPEHADVKIALTRSEGALRIAVTDSGPGIPDDFLPRLFEKFTQLDSSDTRQKGGTGLGLAISKAIIEKHGGKIGVASTPGKGSTFYFELPELLSQIDANNDYLPKVLADSRQATVLIVEDDADIATLIHHMIAQAGHSADIAYDAAHARRLLSQNRQRYQLMTLDIMLPDESGLELLGALRRDAKTRDLPVVVISAKAEEAKQELHAGATGVLDWLSKPIDQTRLINVVKQITLPDRLPKILHVEDEADVHQVVSALLNQYCDMVWTPTLAASKEALANHDFDLVLLDIGLPDGSGLDLLTTIKRYVKPPRVVIFSAHDVSREYTDQVNAVLVKSKTSNQQLLDTLNSAIQKADA